MKIKIQCLPFSSDLDGVYAHILLIKNTTKIDIDLEDYCTSSNKRKQSYTWQITLDLAPSAVSVFNIKTKKITKISPSRLFLNQLVLLTTLLNEQMYPMQCKWNAMATRKLYILIRKVGTQRF